MAVELLYLPYWLAVFETRAASGTGQLAVLVCRNTGLAAHIPPDALEPGHGPTPLPASLDPDAAVDRAVAFADRVLLMAARGRRRRERGPLLRSEPCAYPYWVAYFERRGAIDFRALDPLSAKPAGAAARGAIAQALERDAALHAEAGPPTGPGSP